MADSYAHVLISLGIFVMSGSLYGDNEPCDAHNCGQSSAFDETHSEESHSVYKPESQHDIGPICFNLSVIPILENEPQTWQHVRTRNVIVFSAFTERRLNANGPSIRIIASGLQVQFNDIGDLFCQLWFENEDHPRYVKAIYDRIYPSTMHAEMWVSHFIFCPLNVKNISLLNEKRNVPYVVSVVPEPCDEPNNFLMVLHISHVKQTETFALCLPPIYGRFSKWKEIIENMELNKLFGANAIVAYNQSMAAQTSSVLHKYQQHGGSKMTIVQWKFPDVVSNVFCQRGALNDCLYRMGNQHKYVIITDLDEFLVPRETTTWPQLLASIGKPVYGAYLFQHAYFRRNNTGEEPYLITMQSLWRTHEVIPAGKIRCKSMYVSDKAVSLDLHFAYSLVPGAKEYIVEPNEGMLHHYRKDPMEYFRKYPEKYTYIEDMYMHKYKEKLVEAFSAKIEYIET